MENSDKKVEELRKLIKQWKDGGFIKTSTDKLGWNDIVRIIDNKGDVIKGMVCKVYSDEKNLLIKEPNEESSDYKFKKVFFDNICKLYYSKYVKAPRKSLVNYLPKDFLESDD